MRRQPYPNLAYYMPLDFANQIDPHWNVKRCLNGHWRNTDGKLLTTLDEVVRAFLAGELYLIETKG